MNPAYDDHRRISFLPVLLAWLSVCTFSLTFQNAEGQSSMPTRSAEIASSVSIERSALDKATIYGISDRDCMIKWIAYDTEANRGVVKHWSQCAEPLVRQLPLLTEICTVFFRDDKNAQAFRTLFWGGLEAERQPASQEMSLRLALAAHNSPGWDAARGRPKSAGLNGFVRDLTNEAMIYPELRDLFNRFHRSIRVAAVEKVRVQKAGRLPFFEQLAQRGVKPSAKLPFDCMTWFAVSSASQD